MECDKTKRWPAYGLNGIMIMLYNIIVVSTTSEFYPITRVFEIFERTTMTIIIIVVVVVVFVAIVPHDDGTDFGLTCSARRHRVFGCATPAAGRRRTRVRWETGKDASERIWRARLYVYCKFLRALRFSSENDFPTDNAAHAYYNTRSRVSTCVA